MKNHPSRLSAAHQQRGAAALVVTTLLFFVMVLVTLFVNRNLVFEQRASANQYRATQAFEAAEAGAEWALAQLNNPQRVGPDCLPTADTAATSFRNRTLNQTSAAFAPRTWNNAGVATPLQPTCVRSASGWNCSCPTNGAPTVSAPEGDGLFPAFSVQFVAGDKPGTLRVSATGCTSLAGVCLPGSPSKVDASARIDMTMGLLAGLRTPPAAALTARGNIDADGASFGAHNADPATGLALHAGTGIAAGNARLTTAAGAPLASAQQSHDAGLAALSTDRFFASYFGLDKARWKSQPAVQRIVCGSDCAAAIASAAAATDGSALVWIDGDLALDGTVTVGSALQPVVIVVDGTASLRGAVAFHGLLYSTALSWNDTAVPGAVLRGAALSETTYTGNGAPDLVYDSGVLATLKTHSDSFARINGGWRDF